MPLSGDAPLELALDVLRRCLLEWIGAAGKEQRGGDRA